MAEITYRRAIFSRDCVHRLRLDRTVGIALPHEPRRVTFIGVNPSDADGQKDDHTVRKLAGFCELWGFSDFTVVNVFSRVATDVKQLADLSISARSPRAHGHFEQAMVDAQIIVPMWGSRGKLPRALHIHLDTTRIWLEQNYRPRLRAFGYTASHDPMHPLMLGYNTPLVEWR